MSSRDSMLVAASTEPHYHCNQTILCSSTKKKSTAKGIFLVERFALGENSEQISLISARFLLFLPQLRAVAVGVTPVSLWVIRAAHEGIGCTLPFPAHTRSGSCREQASPRCSAPASQHYLSSFHFWAAIFVLLVPKPWILRVPSCASHMKESEKVGLGRG